MSDRTLRLALASAAWLLPAACSTTAAPAAGPPPRPLFHEVDGLKWGMTPDEVRAVWGPGEEGKAYSYENRSGYRSVSLGYMSWPEHLTSLTWHLAPAGLVTWVPRSEWARIRGQVPLDYTAEADRAIGAFRWGVDGTGAPAIAKALGPPNLQLEEKPGQTELVYLFLNDTVQKLRMADGKLQGVSGQSRNP